MTATETPSSPDAAGNIGRACKKCGAELSVIRSRTKTGVVRRHCYACMREKSRHYRAEYPGYNREKNLRWRQKYRHKYLAHKRVENAIKAGKLQRSPCEVCGATEVVHAHHDDYLRPLDVIWLCFNHHLRRHLELAAAGRDPDQTDVLEAAE